MSELDNAVDAINDAAERTDKTTKFADEWFTADDETDVTNPNNGVTVPSAQKKIKELIGEEGVVSSFNGRAGEVTAEAGDYDGLYLKKTTDTFTGTITYDNDNAVAFADWSGAFYTSELIPFTTGGLSMKLDGILFAHVGEHYDVISTYYNVPSASVDNIVLTCDGKVIFASNATSVANRKEAMLDETGAFYVPNGVYDASARVYSPVNNNIGTGSTNYSAGNHTHDMVSIKRPIKTISSSTYTLLASDFGKTLIFTSSCDITLPLGLSSVTELDMELFFNVSGSEISPASGVSLTAYTYSDGVSGDGSISSPNVIRGGYNYGAQRLICSATNTYISAGAMRYA